MEKVNNKKERNRGIYTRHNPSVNGKPSTAGITLIALIVTIIVLLILARSNDFGNYWK